MKNNKKLLVVFVDLVRKKKNDSFRVAGESLGISVVWDNILPFEVSERATIASTQSISEQLNTS